MFSSGNGVFSPCFSSAIAYNFKKTNVEIFSKLHFDFFGIELNSECKKWFSSDGKELRGSILSGDKRGEAVVQMVSHEQRVTYAESFYNGKKESEIPCVRELVKKGFSNQKISLDALHLNPETTALIHENQGNYLIGLKDNQSELLDELRSLTHWVKPENIQIDEPVKEHGRIDSRVYKSVNISDLYFDKRWGKSGFQTLVWVERTSWNAKNNTESQEISYYVSNQKRGQEQGNELFSAVRNHWKTETNNYVRDVSLREDQLRTKYAKSTQLLACCRTLVVNFLTQEKLKNIRAKMESFVDDFNKLINFLKKKKIL